MAITYVGGVTGSRAGSTSTTTQSLSTTLTGGSNNTPSVGDLIIVNCATGTQARTPAMAITSPSGFVALGQQNATVDTQDVSANVSWKFYTGAGDNTITIPQSGNTADGQAWAIAVYRGVDPYAPFDVASTTATGNNTARPDPASITPVTAGAWIVVCAASGSADGTTAHTFADMDLTIGANGSDTNDGRASLAHETGWTSGAFNPAASTTGSTNTNDSWVARTIALRPYIPNVVQTMFTNNSAAGFYLSARDVQYFDTTSASGTSLTAFGSLFGRWHDISGNNNDAVQATDADRWTATNSTWEFYGGGTTDMSVANVGGSTSAFYFAAAMSLGSYYGTVYSDQDAVNNNNGFRIYHNSDGRDTGSPSAVQIIGFAVNDDADTSNAAEFGEPDTIPDNQVLLTYPGTLFANAALTDLVVVEFWWTGAGTPLRGRIDTHAVTSSVNNIASVTAGSTTAYLNALANTTDVGTGGMRLYEVLVTKNFCPSTAERDSIRAFLTNAVRSGGARGLVGHELTSARGTLTPLGPDTEVALTGHQMTSARGTMGVTHENALTGQAMTSARGSFGVTHENALTGHAMTSARGTMGAELQQALVGHQLTSARGTMGVDHENALTGLSMTSAHGEITGGYAADLVGHQMTSAFGTMGVEHENALTGLSMTAARGTMGAGSDLTIALSGHGMTSAFGTLSPATDFSRDLVGLQMTASKGNMTVLFTRALTGLSVTTARGTMSTPTVLQGKLLSITPNFLTPNLSKGITGHSVTVARGTVTPVITRPPVALLRDSFSTGALLSQWTSSATANGINGVSINSARLRTTVGGTAFNTAQVRSTNSWSLDESSAFVKIENFLRTSGDVAGAETFFKLRWGGTGTGDEVGFWIQANGALEVDIRDADVSIGGGYPTAIVVSGFFAVQDTYRWLRIRESGGTLFFDTAPSTASNPPIASDWVNRHSVSLATVPFSASIGELYPVLGAAIWSGTPTITTQPEFDGFNMATTATEQLVGHQLTTRTFLPPVSMTKALTGHQMTVSRGTISFQSPDIFVPLTGHQMTVSRGAMQGLQDIIDIELTGLSMTTAAGQMEPDGGRFAWVKTNTTTDAGSNWNAITTDNGSSWTTEPSPAASPGWTKTNTT